MKRSFVSLPLVALMLVVTALPTFGAKKSDPAKWVPQDALVYVGIRDWKGASESMDKTAMMRMSEDDALQAAMQPMKKFIENLKSVMADELGLDSPKALEVYPEGGVAFYVTATLDESNEPIGHLALAMDMGENVGRAKALATSVLDASLKRGGTKDTKEIAGKTITIVRFKDGDAPESAEPQAKTQSLIERLFDGVEVQDQVKMMVAAVLSEAEMPEEFAYVFDESRLIIGSDVETTTDALKRITRGSENSLMGSDAMRTLRRHVEKKADAHVIVNIPEIVSLVTKAEPESVQTANAMGFNKMGALVASMELAPSKKIDTRTIAFLDLGEGERVGIPRILSMENTRTKPPATVPDDVMMYGSMNLSLANMFTEILAIAERGDPSSVQRIRANMKIPTQDGGVVDLEKDVLAHLVGPLSGMMRAEKPYENDNFNAFIGLGHDAKDSVSLLLTKAAPPGFLMPTEMLGQTVYGFPMVPGLSLAVTDGTFLIATQNAAESFIRDESKSDGALAGSKTFKAAAKQVPKETSAYLYVDQRRGLEAQAAIVKKGDMPVGGMPPFGMPAGAMLRWMLAQSADEKLLEQVDVVTKYMPVEIISMATESDGIRIDMVRVNVN